MLQRKKNNLLHNLANLFVIQNDYILEEDKKTVLELYSALANGIDRRHGGEKLVEYANEAFKIRHPDYKQDSAENSSTKVGGN